MARLVVLGHGGFDTKSEMVLVPPNTTITFLADAGSNLLLPSISTLGPGERPTGPWQEGVNCRFDYAAIANVLDNYVQAETPRKAGDVLPNMILAKAGAETQKVANDLLAQNKWGGDILLNPTSDRWYLCTGTGATCPTPMLNVAKSRHEQLQGKGPEVVSKFKEWVEGGATGALPEGLGDFTAPELTDVPQLFYKYVLEGVPEKAWHHDCNGILDAKCGEGYDIIWLACSGFAVNQDALNAIGLPEGLPAEMTANTDGPALSWSPKDADLDRISALNAQKVKDTPDGETIRIRAGGVLVLVGDGHEANAENYVQRQGDFSEGKLTVSKGGAFSKGGIKIENLAPAKQQLVVDSIALFSEKKVSFA